MGTPTTNDGPLSRNPIAPRQNFNDAGSLTQTVLGCLASAAGNNRKQAVWISARSVTGLPGSTPPEILVLSNASELPKNALLLAITRMRVGPAYQTRTVAVTRKWSVGGQGRLTGQPLGGSHRDHVKPGFLRLFGLPRLLLVTITPKRSEELSRGLR